MVWNSDKDVEILEPGEYVMGDIHTLGWVIIKSYECIGSELKGYSKEVQNIVGKGTPFAKWNTIQNSDKNEMKSNHFIALEPHSNLFDSRQGKRMMKITKNDKVDKNPFQKEKHVLKWFDTNLEVAKSTKREIVIMFCSAQFLPSFSFDSLS